MEIKEAIRSALKELILPEIDAIRNEYKEIKAILAITNKRMDDFNLHLASQGRRIDEISKRIDETNQRIDETNQRIDETNQRIDETNQRIDETKDFLIARIDRTNERIDETNFRLNNLYEVIVKREEHEKLDLRVIRLEADMASNSR